jgi:hypothetical protein
MKQPTDDACKNIEALFAGKTIAYAISHHVGWEWRLSIVVAGEAGHFPIGTSFAAGTQDEMTALADRLNAERLHHRPADATAIIAKSMFGPGIKRRPLEQLP